MGLLEFDPRFKIDRMASGILEFSSGTASFTCGTQVSDFQHASIFGTEGRVEMDLPINPPIDKPYGIRILRGADCQKSRFDITNQFTLQFDQFSQAIIEDRTVPIPLEDACNNMKVIDAIIGSHKSCKWHRI
jgi:predicted dehydrogenase